MATGNEPPEDFVLPAKFVGIPLEALNASGRRQIALHLNLDGSLNDDINLINNFTGLAEMIGFSYLEIKNFERQTSPTLQLLADWTSRADLSPTVGALWNNLLELERVDVLTDIWKFIKRDCEKYVEIKSKFQSNQSPIQDMTVSQSSERCDHDVDESAIMGVDDVIHGIPTMYDAFICYNPEGEDLKFVRQLIHILEEKNGLKLFVPWRDDLPGASHNTICAKLIQYRCKRMIIVLSPRYLKSSACDFQTKFAHGLSPGSRNKKLIPVLIEQCVMPEILQHITCCNYTRKELLEWFWTRLISSLKATLDPSECRFPNHSVLDSISLDTSSSVSDWSSSSSASSSTTGASLYSSGSSESTSGSVSEASGSAVYLQPYPPYLELLAVSPPLPRRSNDYERISNVRRAALANAASSNVDKDSANYTQPITSQKNGVYQQQQRNNQTTPQQTINRNNQSQHQATALATNAMLTRLSPTRHSRPMPPIPTEDSRKPPEEREYFC